MINTLSKLLTRSFSNPMTKRLCKKIQYNYEGIKMFYTIEIPTLSDKWHIDFSYNPASLTLNEQKNIRPYSFSRILNIRFVQKSQRFVKGRQQYRVQLMFNQTLQLASWSPKTGQFQIIKTNQYKEEVLTVEQVIKTQHDPTTKEFPNSIKNETFPIKLYRFNFYNNKLEGEKAKDFYMNVADFMLFQETLKSSFNLLTFGQSKEEYEISKLERQIIKGEMTINREQQ